MTIQKLSYDEAIEFILDNFSSVQELTSLLDKYNAGARYKSNFPEMDFIIINNLTLLNSIAGEINSGQLDLFGKELDIDTLKYWINSHYSTKDQLEGIVDLYLSGGRVEDVHIDFVIKNNFDNIVQIFQDKYFDNEIDQEVDNKEQIGEAPIVSQQVEEQQSITDDNTNINEIRSGVNTFSIKLFNDNEIMRKYKSFSDIPSDTEFLDVLQATLQQMVFNFKEMHWNVRGAGFKGIHEIFGEVYDKLEDYIDEIIETRFSNNDSFDSMIQSFVFNSVVPQYEIGMCPYEKSCADITTLLELLVSKTIDPLYADVIGRLTSDLNHYKYLITSYKDKSENPEEVGMENNEVPLTNPQELADATYVITDEGMPLPTDVVVEAADNNKVPSELAYLKQFCTTKRQARCFNELVNVFKHSKWVLTYMLGNKQLTKEFDSPKEAEDWVQEQESNCGANERFVKISVDPK